MNFNFSTAKPIPLNSDGVAPTMMGFAFGGFDTFGSNNIRKISEEEEEEDDDEEEEEEEEEEGEGEEDDNDEEVVKNLKTEHSINENDDEGKMESYDKKKTINLVQSMYKMNYMLGEKIEKKGLKPPNFRAREKRPALSDFRHMKLDLNSFPTHQFIASFFYDSYLYIDRIKAYYDAKAIFSASVDLQDSPAIKFFEKYARNMLLPNDNYAVGSGNIFRAQRDFLFPSGFKAVPMSCSFMELAPGLYTYVFHGVFEAIFNDSKSAEIMFFDRSFTIGNRGKFVILNDHIYIHMYNE